MSLEKSRIFHKGEISCIVKLDWDGNPFISEVLLIERVKLNRDEF